MTSVPQRERIDVFGDTRGLEGPLREATELLREHNRVDLLDDFSENWSVTRATVLLPHLQAQLVLYRDIHASASALARVVSVRGASRPHQLARIESLAYEAEDRARHLQFEVRALMTILANGGGVEDVAIEGVGADEGEQETSEPA